MNLFLTNAQLFTSEDINWWTGEVWITYIYIYAFSRRFYPKRLTLHSSYSFTFYQLLLSLGIEPMILALLAPCSTIWATGKWILVDYCDVFISCLDSHSDGTHSLQRIHWPTHTASDVMLHFSKSVPMQKQTHLHIEWPEGEDIFSKSSYLCERFL